MPLTPQQALERCPVAKLTAAERDAFEQAKASIDEQLVTNWLGGPYNIAVQGATQIVIHYVKRAYEQHGWLVQIAGARSALAATPEDVKKMVDAGAALEWMIMIAPDWTR